MEHERIACAGGLDLVTPANEWYRKARGRCRLMANFLPTEAGYKRVQGYERVADEGIPGEGDIKVIFRLQGILYAMRTVAADGQTGVYRLDEEAGRWERVTLGGRIILNSAGLGLPLRGTFIGTSSTDAVEVIRARYLAGGRDGSAESRMEIVYRGAPDFAPTLDEGDVLTTQTAALSYAAALGYTATLSPVERGVGYTGALTTGSGRTLRPSPLRASAVTDASRDRGMPVRDFAVDPNAITRFLGPVASRFGMTGSALAWRLPLGGTVPLPTARRVAWVGAAARPVGANIGAVANERFIGPGPILDPIGGIAMPNGVRYVADRINGTVVTTAPNADIAPPASRPYRGANGVVDSSGALVPTAGRPTWLPGTLVAAAMAQHATDADYDADIFMVSAGTPETRDDDGNRVAAVNGRIRWFRHEQRRMFYTGQSVNIDFISPGQVRAAVATGRRLLVLSDLNVYALDYDTGAMTITTPATLLMRLSVGQQRVSDAVTDGSTLWVRRSVGGLADRSNAPQLRRAGAPDETMLAHSIERPNARPFDEMGPIGSADAWGADSIVLVRARGQGAHASPAEQWRRNVFVMQPEIDAVGNVTIHRYWQDTALHRHTFGRTIQVGVGAFAGGATRVHDAAFGADGVTLYLLVGTPAGGTAVVSVQWAGRAATAAVGTAHLRTTNATLLAAGAVSGTDYLWVATTDGTVMQALDTAGVRVPARDITTGASAAISASGDRLYALRPVTRRIEAFGLTSRAAESADDEVLTDKAQNFDSIVSVPDGAETQHLVLSSDIDSTTVRRIMLYGGPDPVYDPYPAVFGRFTAGGRFVVEHEPTRQLHRLSLFDASGRVDANNNQLRVPARDAQRQARALAGPTTLVIRNTAADDTLENQVWLPFAAADAWFVVYGAMGRALARYEWADTDLARQLAEDSTITSWTVRESSALPQGTLRDLSAQAAQTRDNTFTAGTVERHDPTTYPPRLTNDNARFDFVRHNFFGQGGFEQIWGVTGTDQAWSFDGATISRIEVPLDRLQQHPSFVAAYKNHLVLGYTAGSFFWSGLGDPYEFGEQGGGALAGAGENAIGDYLTNLHGEFKETLFVTGRNTTYLVQGQPGSREFEVKTLSTEVGGFPHTTTVADTMLVFDDRGVRAFEATLDFGDFNVAAVSRIVQPAVDTLRDKNEPPLGVVRVRRESSAWWWFGDGSVLVLTYVRRMGRQGLYMAPEFTTLRLPKPIVYAFSDEGEDGRERVFFTLEGEDHVYEWGRAPDGTPANGFDGAPVTNAILVLGFDDQGYPDWTKSYRFAHVDTAQSQTTALTVDAIYDDGRFATLARERRHERPVNAPSVLWDDATWGAFSWDGRQGRGDARGEYRLRGHGRNLAVRIRQPDDRVVEPVTITGLTVGYLGRKEIRRG